MIFDLSNSSVAVMRRAVVAALIFSSAAMAQAASSCDRGEMATVPLTFTDDLRPLVDASINGHIVPAMLNLGSAQTTILNKKTLERLGIEVRQVTSTTYRQDKDSTGAIIPTGNVIVREGLSAMVKDYAAIQARGKNMSFLVEDFIDDTFGARIGASSLLQTDLELDLDAGYLKYFKPRGCLTEHLAYWDANAVVVPVRLDLWKRDPRPVFSVRINGKQAWALLSTATPHSYLPDSAAVRLGLTSTSPGARREAPLPGHDESKPVWKVPLAQMSIGAMEIKDFSLRLMDLPHAGDILILGADFLQRHRVYIALGQKQVYFSPITQPTLKRGSVKVIPRPIDS